MSAPASSRTITPRRRRAVWLGAALLAALAGVVVVINHRRNTQGEQELREAVAGLDAAFPDGWRLENLEARRPSARADAEDVVATLAAMPPPLAQWQGDQSHRVLARLQPPVRPTPDELRAVRAGLEAVRPLLDRLAPYAEPRPVRFGIDWRPNVFRTPLPHLHSLLSVSRILALSAVDREEAGDRHGALAACRAALNTAGWCRDVPVGEMQFGRMAMAHSAGLAIQRLLAQYELPAEQLAALQRQVEDGEGPPPFVVIRRGSLARLYRFFEAFGRGEVSFGEFDPAEGARWDRAAARHYLWGLVATNIRLERRSVELTRLPLHEQSEAVRRLDQEFQESRRAGPMPSLLFQSAPEGELVNSLEFHRRQRCLASVLAAERFRLARGRWPDTLAELTPDFLASVPLDPATGQPLRLRRLPDGLEVVGTRPGRQDGGGPKSASAGTEPGYRLWDVARRRQQPPPEEGPAP
jgi:hypothetical protein